MIPVATTVVVRSPSARRRTRRCERAHVGSATRIEAPTMLSDLVIGASIAMILSSRWSEASGVRTSFACSSPGLSGGRPQAADGEDHAARPRRHRLQQHSHLATNCREAGTTLGRSPASRLPRVVLSRTSASTSSSRPTSPRPGTRCSTPSRRSSSRPMSGIQAV